MAGWNQSASSFLLEKFVDLMVYFPLLNPISILLFMKSIILCISRRSCCQYYALLIKRFFVVVAVYILTGRRTSYNTGVRG